MKILVFEGLGGMGMGYLQKGLLDPFLNKYPKAFTYDRVAYNQKVAPFAYDVVIGHSLGGEAALRYVEANPKCKVCQTLDPRRNNIVSCFDIVFPFQAPFGVPPVPTYNFIHSSFPPFMPGYHVKGALNVTVKGYSHTGMTAAPQVSETLARVLGLAK